MRADELDALTEYFLWQTVVGAWPISEERLQGYALKAIRESKLFTRWTEPDEAYEAAVERFVTGVVTSPEIVSHVEAWVEATRPATRAAVLGQKLVQLTMPGIPDVYQGTDLVDLSLVDPDNRRLVDYDERTSPAGAARRGRRPGRPARREAARHGRRPAHPPRRGPSASSGRDAGYHPLDTTSPHAVAFGRGTHGEVAVVTVVTRLAGRLHDAGGFGDATVTLPEGSWTDVLSHRTLRRRRGRPRLAHRRGRRAAGRAARAGWRRTSEPDGRGVGARTHGR